MPSKANLYNVGAGAPMPSKIAKLADNDALVNASAATVNIAVAVATSAVTSVVSANLESKSPTTFLTLPRELRQKILYLSCPLRIQVRPLTTPDSIPDSTLHPTPVSTLDSLYSTLYSTLYLEIWRICLECISESHAHIEDRQNDEWATTLSEVLKTSVPEDVEYLKGKWKDEVTGILRKCTSESGELLGRLSEYLDSK